jgi:anti-sigma factor ChrR (cupin superfamily)
MGSPRPFPHAIVPHELPWEVLLPGVYRKRLWAEPMWDDPTTSREMSMVRYDAGITVPLHKHAGGDEIVFVIEGVLSDEFGDISAGNVGYRPDGCVHSLHSNSGATTLSYLVGRSEMISEWPVNSAPSQIINVNKMIWQAEEGGQVQMKMIWQDRATDRRFILAKLASGAVIPLHDHVGDELVFQIEGSLVDEAGLLSPGSVGYRPYGCRHSLTSPNGGLGLSYIWGRSDYI